MSRAVSKYGMRGLLVGLILLCGCGPGLVYHAGGEFQPDAWVAAADFGFVGVVRKQQLDSWPLWRPNWAGADPYWKVLRREVEVEIPIKGEVRRGAVVDVYELVWMGGLIGNRNRTNVGSRGVYWVRVENRKWHLLEDWQKTICTILSGRHERLPGGDSMPVWERIALANWWFETSAGIEQVAEQGLSQADPAGRISLWRRAKLARGLMRHPSSQLRVAACRELLELPSEQDDCWEELTALEQQALRPKLELRKRVPVVEVWSVANQDERRLLTTVRDEARRKQFCELYLSTYPGDREHGCPPYGPRPATRVTASGDETLAGEWPRDGR